METTVSKPVVWVANFAGHPYEKAVAFGEVKFLTKGYVSFQSLDRLKFHITQLILEVSEDDYLLLSGTNLICVLAALAWITHHGKIRILNWDKTSESYREMVVSAESMIKLMEVLSADDSQTDRVE